MHTRGDCTTVHRFCCIGAGILGVPQCAVLASQYPEFQVSVVDEDVDVINGWKSNIAYIDEPGLSELLKECLGRNLVISAELERYIKESDVILICVKTPTKLLGVGRGRAADLSCMESVARRIADSGNQSAIVVVQSTAPIGAADLIKDIFQANCPTASHCVLTNPQFIAEGTVIQNLLHPDRVLIGGDLFSERSLQAINTLKHIYTRWIPEDTIIIMSTRSAEVAKLATNAVLAQRISSINAMSSVCEETNADVRQLADAVGRDTRIGPQFLEASLGFGGNTLPSDLHHLVYTCESLKLPVVAAYWNSILSINEFQASRFFRKITSHYNQTLKNKRIVIFGCAFKKGTPDVKNSPALFIIYRLLQEGTEVAIYDPLAIKEETLDAIASDMGNMTGINGLIDWCATPEEAVTGSDGIVIATDCDMFSDLDYKKFYMSMRKPASLFDGRLIVDHERLLEIGFRVEAVGVSLKRSSNFKLNSKQS